MGINYRVGYLLVLIAAVVLDGQQRWVPLAAYLIVTMLFVKLYMYQLVLKKMSD